MKQETNLIVFANSPQWSSAINRYFPDARITWALNAEQLEKVAFSGQHGAIIVEFTNESMIECCAKAQLLHNNSGHWLTLAVGHPTIAHNNDRTISVATKNYVHALGFAYWATSLLQMPVLKSAVEYHELKTIPPFSGSIEERIWRTLPWATASTDRQA